MTEQEKTKAICKRKFFATKKKKGKFTKKVKPIKIKKK